MRSHIKCLDTPTHRHDPWLDVLGGEERWWGWWWCHVVKAVCACVPMYMCVYVCVHRSPAGMYELWLQTKSSARAPELCLSGVEELGEVGEVLLSAFVS